MRLETELKIIANEMRSALAILEDSSVRVGLTKKDWRKIETELGKVDKSMSMLVKKIESEKTGFCVCAECGGLFFWQDGDGELVLCSTCLNGEEPDDVKNPNFITQVDGLVS
jgi:hypothetical protein